MACAHDTGPVAQPELWLGSPCLRSVRASEECLLAVGVALARIETQPTAQVIVDVDTGARRALLRKFPHRVIDLIDGGTIVVFAVMPHRRDVHTWPERLG